MGGRAFRRSANPRHPTPRARSRKRLQFLRRARNLEDLRGLPSNRLEALAGDRVGQFSIRINRQWRICIRWHEGDAWDVEIVDYH
ncbi:MAG TPA: type II toxin-antitoxin system RelE/ParE family toxin [Geminicoccaceae bacterium]|nr:type II toxin-antitoxin system RelE/ParE family toxin [Geminicoccaceae bacterium]